MTPWVSASKRLVRACALPLLAVLVATAVLVGLLEILPDGPPGQAHCSGSDYGCRLNVNQGALTVIGLVVAAVSGLVAYRDFSSGRRERQRERDRDVARFSSVYFDALYEALHNLVHIAQAFADQGEPVLESWPHYDLRYAAKLLEPPNSDFLNPQVRPFVDHMLRNDRYIQRVPDTNAGRATILADAGYLAEHALRFLLEAWCARGSEAAEANALFEKLRTSGALRSLTDEKQELRLKASGFRVRMLRSKAERKPMDPGTVVLWWFDDSDTLTTTRLFADLRDCTDPPPRPLRPAAPQRTPRVQGELTPPITGPLEHIRNRADHDPEDSTVSSPRPVDSGAQKHRLKPRQRRALLGGTGLVAAAIGLAAAIRFGSAHGRQRRS